MSVSNRVENDTCGSSAICGIWRICGILGTLGVSDACATYVEDVVYDNSMWYMWNFGDIWYNYNTGISKCCNEPLSIVKIFLIQRSRTGCSVFPRIGFFIFLSACSRLVLAPRAGRGDAATCTW